MKKTLLLLLYILLTPTITGFMIAPSATGTQLHYKVRPPRTTGAKPPLLLLLHGVGSNEQDLFSLADQLPGKYLVVSARGPLTLAPNSFAWFHVSFSTGRPVINQEEAESARKTIIQFIEALRKEQDFNEQEVYLMGFSQGGIMSYSVALTAPEKVKGIAVMSGRLLPEVKPLAAPDNRLQKVKIFVSHGTSDPVLPYQYALDAVEYLKSHGLHPDLHTYQDAHTINAQMLADVVKWLN